LTPPNSSFRSIALHQDFGNFEDQTLPQLAIRITAQLPNLSKLS